MTLNEPRYFAWDERLTEADKKTVDELNASLDKLHGLRALEINVSGPFARSKIAWKLAMYQQVLLHRIVALVDGATVAYNSRCTLSAMLSARAFMETMAAMGELESRVAKLIEEKDLGELDSLAQNGIFASRDAEWIKEFPETKAVNVLTYISKFDERAKGFRSITTCSRSAVIQMHLAITLCSQRSTDRTVPSNFIMSASLNVTPNSF